MQIKRFFYAQNADHDLRLLLQFSTGGRRVRISETLKFLSIYLFELSTKMIAISPPSICHVRHCDSLRNYWFDDSVCFSAHLIEVFCTLKIFNCSLIHERQKEIQEIQMKHLARSAIKICYVVQFDVVTWKLHVSAPRCSFGKQSKCQYWLQSSREESILCWVIEQLGHYRGICRGWGGEGGGGREAWVLPY